MSDQGRFTIWKGEPTLDSWYNAAVGSNASPRTIEETTGEEVLFLNIAKSNQVKYPSDGANDWFYGSAIGDGTIVESALSVCETCNTSANMPQTPTFMLRKLVALRQRRTFLASCLLLSLLVDPPWTSHCRQSQFLQSLSLQTGLPRLILSTSLRMQVQRTRSNAASIVQTT